MKSTGVTIALLTVLASITVAGCNGPTTPKTAPKPTGPDPVEAKINALTPALQRVTFFRAIQDAGYTCQKIVTAESRPRIDDHAVWAVVCDDQGQYLITLQPGGIFQVSGVPQPGKAN